MSKQLLSLAVLLVAVALVGAFEKRENSVHRSAAGRLHEMRERFVERNRQRLMARAEREGRDLAVCQYQQTTLNISSTFTAGVSTCPFPFETIAIIETSSTTTTTGGSGGAIYGGATCPGCNSPVVWYEFRSEDDSLYQAYVLPIDGSESAKLTASQPTDDHYWIFFPICECDRTLYITELDDTYTIAYGEFGYGDDMAPQTLHSSQSGVLADVVPMCACGVTAWVEVSATVDNSYTVYTELNVASGRDNSATAVHSSTTEEFGSVSFASCKCGRMYWTSYIGGDFDNQVVHTSRFGEDTHDVYFTPGASTIASQSYCPCSWSVLMLVNDDNGPSIVIKEMGDADTDSATLGPYGDEQNIVALEVGCDCDRLVWVQVKDTVTIVGSDISLEPVASTISSVSDDDTLTAVVSSCGCDLVFWSIALDDGGYRVQSQSLKNYDDQSYITTLVESGAGSFGGVFPFDCHCDDRIFYSTYNDDGHETVSSAEYNGENSATHVVTNDNDQAIAFVDVDCVCGRVVYGVIDGDSFQIITSDLDGSNAATIASHSDSTFSGYEPGCGCDRILYEFYNDEGDEVLNVYNLDDATNDVVFTDNDDVIFYGALLDDVGDRVFYHTYNDGTETLLFKDYDEDTTSSIASVTDANTFHTFIFTKGSAATVAPVAALVVAVTLFAALF